jgi:hypothetical protein
MILNGHISPWIKSSSQFVHMLTLILFKSKETSLYAKPLQRSVSPPTLIKGEKKIICFDIVLPHTIML